MNIIHVYVCIDIHMHVIKKNFYENKFDSGRVLVDFLTKKNSKNIGPGPGRVLGGARNHLKEKCKYGRKFNFLYVQRKEIEQVFVQITKSRTKNASINSEFYKMVQFETLYLLYYVTANFDPGTSKYMHYKRWGK